MVKSLKGIESLTSTVKRNIWKKAKEGVEGAKVELKFRRWSTSGPESRWRCEPLVRLTGHLLCIEMPAKMPREWTGRCKRAQK